MIFRRCNACGEEIPPDAEYLRVRSSLCKNYDEDAGTIVSINICEACSREMMYLVEHRDIVLELLKKGADEGKGIKGYCCENCIWHDSKDGDCVYRAFVVMDESPYCGHYRPKKHKEE